RLDRPASDRIRIDRHHDRARKLVVPGLLLTVPEHPEVAEKQGNRREYPGEVADDPAAEPDRPSVAKVVDPDAQRFLAERLAGVAPLEVTVVPDADRDRDEAADPTSDDCLDDAGDDTDDDRVEKRRAEA